MTAATGGAGGAPDDVKDRLRDAIQRRNLSSLRMLLPFVGPNSEPFCDSLRLAIDMSNAPAVRELVKIAPPEYNFGAFLSGCFEINVFSS